MCFFLKEIIYGFKNQYTISLLTHRKIRWNILTNLKINFSQKNNAIWFLCRWCFFFVSSFNSHWHSDRQQQTSDIWKMLDWNMHRHRYITQMDWISNVKTKIYSITNFWMFSCSYPAKQWPQKHKPTLSKFQDKKIHRTFKEYNTPYTENTRYTTTTTEKNK